jgi:hypothetical protein
MVQEVQTTITTNTENTLETIEAIWTSSRKIIIWRQTRERIYGESGVKMKFNTWELLLVEGNYYEDLEWTATVYDEVWEMSYGKSWNGVRVPVQWNYSITINCPNGTNTPSWWQKTCITRLTVDKNKVYEYANTVNSVHTETINMTLWKFALLELHIDVDMTASLSWWQIYAWIEPSIIIQKI